MNEEAATSLSADPDLAPLVEHHGALELEPAEDIFERLVTSLVRQQVSMDAAAAIRERLFEAVTVTPAGILAAEEETLREAGLSAAKVEYVKAVARTFEEGQYDRNYFEGLPDEDVIAELTDIRGIGPWTAKMFLMFCLARPDVFPVEDLGIRKGMHAVCDESLTRPEMEEWSREWMPYRSYASLYLWRAVDG